MKREIAILIIFVISLGCGQITNIRILSDTEKQINIENSNQTNFFLIELKVWNKTKEINTIKAYENYLKTFPKGKYIRKARIGKTTILDKQAWAKVRQNNFDDYVNYLNLFPYGKHARDVRAVIKKSCILSDAQIAQINKWQRDKNQRVSGGIEKLIFAGVDCLNSEGEWINHVRGRKIYNILKNCNSKQIIEAVANVMIIRIDRPRVLLLMIKIGVLGTEKILNKLLLKCDNKLMAEDYINSGSKELHEGGMAWAETYRHWIKNSDDDGSCRANWGKF